ncbi:MAG: efflux RND transporter periplasmic adaptor subunit [Magnetospirillum sp. WYHS-4]
MAISRVFRSRGFLVVVAVLAVGGGGVWFRTGQPLEVEILHPATDAPVTVYGLGTVEARILSKLGFEVTGTLIELAADHGQSVKAGQLLARLDDREQRAKLAQAEAQFRQGQAGLAQAQARLDRARATLGQKRNVNQRRQSLVRDGAVSKEAAEDANSAADVAVADVAVSAADLEVARGALEAARAQMQREEALLAKYILAAPYDGLVVERSKELGAAVAPGTSVFTVIDPATVWARAYVDEALAGSLAEGQGAEIRLRSLPGQVFAGRVARIDIESDRIAEERRVHAAFDTIPARFHLGEQAEVLVAVGRAAEGTVIPAVAVAEGAVWLIQDGMLRRRPVRVLKRLSDGRLEVEGLAIRDAVVARPQPGFAEGRKAREKTS